MHRLTKNPRPVAGDFLSMKDFSRLCKPRRQGRCPLKRTISPFSFSACAKESRECIRRPQARVFQCKVPCIQQMHFSSQDVLAISMRARRYERRIVLAPDRQQGRLIFAQVFLKRGVSRYVTAVVKNQVKLDLLCARPRHIHNVEVVAIGRKLFRIGSRTVLPVPDDLR